MRVGVGSGNPVKLAATERALAGRDATVEPVAVESGVPEQPWGEAETVRGARTRARRALRGGAFDLGVGIEGGVAEAAAADGLFLVMWAAVTDGDRVGLGAGPRVRLPDDVADRLAAGAELGPVMDDLTGTAGVKRDRGAAGVLTGGAMDREAALAGAVAGALGPFATDYYDAEPAGRTATRDAPAGAAATDDGPPADARVAERRLRLRPAGADDLDAVEAMLDDADLPTADVRDGTAAFFLASVGDDVVGVGGLEVHGSEGLLRSVAVVDGARGAGHGSTIVRRLGSVARARGVNALYLLTTDAVGFFERFGYETVEREAVPATIRGTAEYATLCPTAATVMRLPLA